jgi:hypothetical protein
MWKWKMEMFNLQGGKHMRKKYCCICGEELEGFGNNPRPYKEEGECCDTCNFRFVVPSRLRSLIEESRRTKIIK